MTTDTAARPEGVADIAEAEAFLAAHPEIGSFDLVLIDLNGIARGKIIRRHGREAANSRKLYTALGEDERRQMVAFLQSLVLYQTDQLPCDLDGDGQISDHFLVGGMDTGPELFRPEWLFRVPGRIEGRIRNLRGEELTSFALTNARQAYGLDLDYLRDSDGDGFPDVIDPAPHRKGYRDGEK